MFLGRFHTFVYWLCKNLRRITFVSILVVLLIQAFPPSGIDRLDKIQNWIIGNQKLLNVTLAGVVTGITLFMKLLGDPWVLDCVKEILESFQRDVFSEVGAGALADHHRVTLYRYQQWCLWPGWRGMYLWPWGAGAWPFSGWMVPIVRAGPDSRATTVFLAKSPTEFEGICGAVYFQQQGVLEKGTPLLPDITSRSSNVDIATYARETFVSEEMIGHRIRNNRPCARYFLAVRVEVQSKKWGVLMIDSREASCPHPNITQHKFRQINKMLTHLLKRA